jgi:hypothetical protein
MIDSEPTIRINVDLTNPGQFFACCGLLELADRLWQGAHVFGAFSPTSFHLSAGCPQLTLKHLIESFVAAEVEQLDTEDNAASPLHLGDPFNLRLDWWKKVETQNKTVVDLGGGHQLKPWAARQNGPLIFRLMRAACSSVPLDNLLNHPMEVFDVDKKGKTKKKTISPFYFDAHRAGTSLDIGFSPDEQEMSVKEYPAVESLALVGLQRFRPRVDESGAIRSFLYTAWADPLPCTVAMAAVSGMMRVRSCGTFRFTKPSRGGDYLSMFSRATLEGSSYV